MMGKLESQGAPDVIDLDVPSWRTKSLGKGSTTIEEPSTAVIPVAGQSLREELFAWPTLKVRELRNVDVDVDSSLVFVEDRVAGQSGNAIRWARDAALITGGYVRARTVQPKAVVGNVAVLGDTHHHYHFMMETLPSAIHIKQASPETRFVTSQDVGSFARGVLEIAGIHVEKLDTGVVIRPERTVLCDAPVRFWPRRADLRVVRETLLGGSAAQVVESSEVVYVSRSRSSRSLRNEHLLENAVANAGVRVVFLEEMSLQEQVQVFATARLVIGPHGAGLSNIVFMQPGSRLVEISSGDGWEPCYRRIAGVMGLEYVFLPAPGDAESPYGNATRAFIDSVLSIVKSDSGGAHSR